MSGPAVSSGASGSHPKGRKTELKPLDGVALEDTLPSSHGVNRLKVVFPGRIEGGNRSQGHGNSDEPTYKHTHTHCLDSEVGIGNLFLSLVDILCG